MTSVGATQGINPETAADFSSGGFSNIFARPNYQSSAVSLYPTDLGSTHSKLYNPTGWRFPDVFAARRSTTHPARAPLGNSS